MMAKKPENRFQTAQDVIQALDRATGSAAAEIAAEVQTGPADPESMWFVKATVKGKEKLFKLDEKKLMALIRQGKVSRSAVFRKGTKSEFQPLGAFPQLGSLPAPGNAEVARAQASGKRAEKGSKRASNELRSLYGDMEEGARRRMKMKKLKKILKVAAILLIIIGVGVAGLMFKDQIMGLFGK